MTNERPPPSIPQQKTRAQLEGVLRRREQRRKCALQAKLVRRHDARRGYYRT